MMIKVREAGGESWGSVKCEALEWISSIGSREDFEVCSLKCCCTSEDDRNLRKVSIWKDMR